MLTLGLDAEAAPPRVTLEEERIRAADAVSSPDLKKGAAADRARIALAAKVSGEGARGNPQAPTEEGERGGVLERTNVAFAPCGKALVTVPK